MDETPDYLGLPTDYLAAVVENTLLFIRAANRAGLEAPVPTCPDWTVGELALHQGRVFRWIGAIVERQSQEFIHPRELGDPVEGENPLVWLKDSGEEILSVLDHSDPDDLVWNWAENGPAPARFWYRRAAHEVVIHRADAEAAAGIKSEVQPAELAADGIDEFLHFLRIRTKTDDHVQLAGSFHFHATDVTGEWVVEFGLSGVTVRRDHAKAAVAVQGPAAELELFLYNRGGTEALKVFGDEAKLAKWSELVRF